MPDQDKPSIHDRQDSAIRDVRKPPPWIDRTRVSAIKPHDPSNDDELARPPPRRFERQLRFTRRKAEEEAL